MGWVRQVSGWNGKIENLAILADLAIRVFSNLQTRQHYAHDERREAVGLWLGKTVLTHRWSTPDTTQSFKAHDRMASVQP